MPQAGGAAAKLGDRFEAYWTVNCILDILDGSARSVRIEPLNDPSGIEFWLKRLNSTEFHQAKRQQSVTDRWTVAALRSAGVLHTIFSRLDGTQDSFYFISLQDAFQLRELADRARGSQNLAEFEGSLSKALARAFTELVSSQPQLKDRWLAVLRRVRAEAVTEQLLRRHTETRLRALVSGNASAAFATLRDFIETNVHNEIDEVAMWQHLSNQGFKRSPWLANGSALAAVESANKRYLENLRRELIEESVIPRRDPMARIAEWMDTGSERVVAIVGAAGIGKSSFVYELAASLSTDGIPYLAFRVDRLSKAQNTRDIGSQIGLEQSPVVILSGIAATKKGILIVDQLDAVSLASGRQPEMFEAILSLLDEAAAVANIRVVIVCRKFDVENDHRIRAITDNTGDTRLIELSGLLDEDVEQALDKRGFDPKKISGQLRTLLKVPLYLKLFISVVSPDAGYSAFATQKDLFDEYWASKQRVLRTRLTSPENWTLILERLAQLCSDTQTLSVPEMVLDRWRADVDILVSEGVLSRERDRLAFFHELFFDYCFARAFLRGGASWADYLASTGQDLFRRGQTRQILTQLRSANYPRYAAHLRALLTKEDAGQRLKRIAVALLSSWSDFRMLMAKADIRVHIKQVVFALLHSWSDPRDDEVELLANLVEHGSEWEQESAWSVLANPAWFDRVCMTPIFSVWTNSAETRILNGLTWLLRKVQSERPDPVAKMLAAKVDSDGDWPQRIINVIQWSKLGASREYFNLFLTLYDKGAIDDAKAPIAANATFWDLTHGLADTNGEYACELIEHHLRRVIASAQPASGGHHLIPDGHGYQELVRKAGGREPLLLLQKAMPLVVALLDKTTTSVEQSAFVRDPIWNTPRFGKAYLGSEALLSALTQAAVHVATHEPSAFAKLFEDLKGSEFYVVQFILLRGLSANVTVLRDLAAHHLLRDTRLLSVGYSNAPSWISAQLVGALAPTLPAEKYAELEGTILNFYPEWERKARAQRYRGSAQLALLAGIPTSCLSEIGKRKFSEWQRKFGRERPEPPREMEGGFVQSPISGTAVKRMTNKQWLRAIARYGSDLDVARRFGSLTGGALQLSQQLEAETKSEPNRFAQLLLQIPPTAHRYYFDAVLRGLAAVDLGQAEFLENVCNYCHDIPSRPCGRWIAAPLAKLVSDGRPLTQSMVDLLAWYAIQDPDPTKEAEARNSNDLLTAGINSVRGAVVYELGTIIFDNPSRSEQLLPIVRRAVRDPSMAVRTCAGRPLLAMLNWNRAIAVDLFLDLIPDADALLGTEFVDDFLYYAAPTHFDSIRPVIERAIAASEESARTIGAKHLALAALEREDVRGSLGQLFAADKATRRGLAIVFAANVKTGRFYEFCAASLGRLLRDSDAEVRSDAAQWLRHVTSEDLLNLQAVLKAHIDSPSVTHDTYALFELFKKVVRPDPQMVFRLSERLVSELGNEAGNIASARFIDGEALSQLMLRVYAQSNSQRTKAACLDGIDKMILLHYYRVEEQLVDYER